MQIPETTFMPLTPAQQLFYPPLAPQMADIFHSRAPLVTSLSTQTLRETLARKKLSQIDICYCEPSAEILPLTALGIACIFVSVFYGVHFSDQEFQNVPPAYMYSSRDFMDSRTGEIVPRSLKFAAPKWAALGAGESDVSGSILVPVVTFGAIVMGVLIQCLYQRIKQRRGDTAVARYNEHIDDILTRLSFVSASEQEAAPPRDVCLAFPYLSDEQLAMLDFSQLQEVYKRRNASFQRALQAYSFSKQQRALWHLLNHILTANHQRQCKILDDTNVRALMRESDPLFFQLLLAELKPSEPQLKAICLDILKADILHETVAQKLELAQLTHIIDSVAGGEELQAAVRALHTGQPLQNLSEDDPYEVFMHTGKLRLDSVDACYDYYKRSLQAADTALAAWFESFLTRHLDFFVQEPRCHTLLAELTDLRADSLKLKIDAHLAQSSLPRFNTTQFEERMQFARKAGLNLYAQALQSHYITALQTYRLPAEGKALDQEVDAFLNQFEELFGLQMPQLEAVLANRIRALLQDAPHTIDELSQAAKDNPWLLGQISRIFYAEPQLYSKFCLCPLDEVIST